MKSVPIISLQSAAAKVRNNQTLLAGGFGMTGSPVNLLHALAETNTKGLTYIGNNIGEKGLGGGRLLRNGQIKKAIGSFFTSNKEAVEAAQSGAIEASLLPQGSLAEAIRAGGAGIGGFFTPTAANTPLSEGSEVRVIDGKAMTFVESLRGDVAFIRAWRADRAGNLQYRMTESNFNRAMATAADLVIVEAEEIVDVGDIQPEHIHTPCCYVDFLVQASITPENLGSSASIANSDKKADPQRIGMAKAALPYIKPGDVVNLGIGIPTLVADFVNPDDNILLHTENGMLGVGPEPSGGGAMDYPVNAGKIPVTALTGASYFDSAESFAMIRGGHIDVAIMGALQVDQQGNLANWSIPGKPLLGVGGAMDLASGAKKLIVTMIHCDSSGSSKIVPECTLPITAQKNVDILITDLAVFQFDEKGMTLKRLMPGVTIEQVQEKTQAHFKTDIQK